MSECRSVGVYVLAGGEMTLSVLIYRVIASVVLVISRLSQSSSGSFISFIPKCLGVIDHVFLSKRGKKGDVCWDHRHDIYIIISLVGEKIRGLGDAGGITFSLVKGIFSPPSC